MKTPTEYKITDYGARANADTLNTKAIQKAIDVCAGKGGGVVVIPAGTFISGSLFLKQSVQLWLQEGAVLKASQNRQDFAVVTNLWAGSELKGPAALVNAGTYKDKGLTDVHIYGKGTLDGSGLKWWQEFWKYQKAKDKPADWANYPKLISVCNGSNINIDGLHLKDSSFWNLHLLYCSHAVVRNLTITAPIGPVAAPSSDGIDVDSSSDVLIEGCYISVSDDGISLKSGRDILGIQANRPTENVIIRNCRFGSGHGVIDCGSEISGWIRNVHATNCTVDGLTDTDPKYGYYNPVVRFKTALGRGGGAENIIVENFHIKNVARLISCEIPFGQNEHWEADFAKAALPIDKGYSHFRNIVIRNFTGECDNPGTIQGYKQIDFRNVLIENINVTCTKSDRFLVGNSVQDVQFRNIAIQTADTNKVIGNNK